MNDPLSDIVKAADILRAGGVVAFPTETVYGLGAVALDASAVRRVYELKGRPSINPLIVHVTGPEMARKVVAPGAWDAAADRLARAFWPGGERAGPLSIVLAKHDSVPSIVTAGGANVAVRCPEHPVALALLFELGLPLVGPSANVSGRVSPTTSAHVRESFAEKDVFVLEGGACRAGIESTVVSLAGGVARVLRPGLVSAAAIAEVLGTRVEQGVREGGESGAGQALESPGLLARHYAPSTPSRLLTIEELLTCLRVLPDAKRVVISHSIAPLIASEGAMTSGARIIQMPNVPELYAQRLYSALREADAEGASEILIERPIDAGPVWAAIVDRLIRATTL